MSDEKFVISNGYKTNHVRSVALRLSKKYKDLKMRHVFWIAKELNIYPDGISCKYEKNMDMTKMGKINNANTEYVVGKGLTDKGIQAIEQYLVEEGYVVLSKEEEKMTETKSIWEQADLISLMKKDYEKAVADRDEYIELATSYEKEIEELKDKLLIIEKENNDLKSEKQQLSEQHSNKRTNHFIEVNGKVMTISQCAKQYNISKSTIRYWAKQYNDVLQIKNCGAKMSEGE